MTQRVEAFVQAVELWVPDGDRLRHHSGAYGDHVEFARVSARKSFARGEGLPGMVAITQRPVVWKELGPLFVRRELARAAGIEAAVGLPVFSRDTLTAVVVLLCGCRNATAGCIEIWDVDESEGRIVHSSGYYGSLRRLETVSRVLEFERGCGLPGMAWSSGEPEVIADLRHASEFTRATLARECGLDAGLAVPIFKGGVVAHVFVLLSAATTPLARAFEVWIPDGAHLEGAYLRLERALYAAPTRVVGSTKAALPRHPANQGLSQRVASTGMPVVFERRRPTLATAPAEDPEMGVGIPVHDGTALRAVVVLSL